MATILIVYHSTTGHTAQLAQHIADGVRKSGHVAQLRAIPTVAYETHSAKPIVPESGAPYVTIDDVRRCDGLILGSPTHFGNVAAPVAHFFEQIGALWLSGECVDKPAGVFTATGSMHGGQEKVLHQLMSPLLHFGFTIVGIPYTQDKLNTTKTGGTPYGASHLSRQDGLSRDCDTDEIAIAHTLGERVARLASLYSSAQG